MPDYYSPRTMRGVIRRTLPLRTFFKTRFFNNSVTFPTETVSFEFQEQKRRLAPYVNPRTGSESIERDDYELKTFRPPLVAPERAITNDTLAQKLLGEALYNSGMTPEDRAVKIAAQDIIDLQDTIYRREEYMCARVKQDGVLTISGKGVHNTVTYGFDNIVQVATADIWSPTADLVGQLDAYADNMQKYGVNPDLLILGSKASKAFLNNDKLLKLLDVKRVEIGEIRPAQLENGVRYIGRVVTPGASFDIYSYAEWYPDDTDLDAQGNPKLKPILDPETAILQSSAEQNSMLYGLVTLIDNAGNFVSHMEEYVPNTWFTQKPPQRFVSISSRPLPMPHDLKSWMVLKNVVTGSAG
ncbi:minor capsid protein E [Synergistales bacterium]|nr:minor capsid protein E [Synergistales bacterium]